MNLLVVAAFTSPLLASGACLNLIRTSPTISSTPVKIHDTYHTYTHPDNSASNPEPQGLRKEYIGCIYIFNISLPLERKLLASNCVRGSPIDSYVFI